MCFQQAEEHAAFWIDLSVLHLASQDICSSWISHYPTEKTWSHAAGHGVTEGEHSRGVPSIEAGLRAQSQVSITGMNATRPESSFLSRFSRRRARGV